jgi:hypothetical protein
LDEKRRKVLDGYRKFEHNLADMQRSRHHFVLLRSGDLPAFVKLTHRFQHFAFGSALALAAISIMPKTSCRRRWSRPGRRCRALPIHLSREMAMRKIYACLDATTSRSRLIDTVIVPRRSGPPRAMVFWLEKEDRDAKEAVQGGRRLLQSCGRLMF